MPWLKIGVTTTTGFVHRFASLSESSSMWSSAALREPLFFPDGSQPFSGMSVLEMECTGIVLPKFQGLFVPGKARNSLFGSRPIDFDVVALRVNVRRPRPPSSLAGFCSTPDGKCYLCS